ncbi:hypothetical protein [Chryseobacterium shigense]|uniref:Lipoprotein n=1 Tax=Chryseobacterium shigense TaxID=297244 RepID=A0A841N4K7_9FLAO|nr:hypothetical protein [Chryseobacterium shigense]MBB6370063.1 hypothetical protein [Chryseobacterium shigense]
MKTIKLIVLLFLFIFFCGCYEKNNQYKEDIEQKNIIEYQKPQNLFKNLKNSNGEIIQTDTCNFTVIFKNAILLKYNNINFKRNAYKDYQFKIILENILEKPLYIKTTNYYGYLQFNWELKKEDGEYILQMTSDTRDYVMDEFKLKKIKGHYSLYKVSNIIPLRNDSQFSKQICTLPIVNLQKDTIIDCTIDNLTNCLSVK